MGISSLDILSLTEEDINKGQMYSQEKQRKSLLKEATDLSDYLKMLDMKLYVSTDNSNNVKRIAQLTQKTNQFNMTTKRYEEKEIKDFLKNPKYSLYTLRLIDKFGDYGLTGLAIIHKDPIWKIDTFLLSCRILGRKVEEAFLAYIVREAQRENQEYLLGQFIRTEKNDPATDFYRSMGLDEYFENEIPFWKLNLNKETAFPNCIKLVEAG